MAGNTGGLRVDSPAPRVTRLLLDRPRQRNAIDTGLVDGLRRAFDQLHAQPARVVVLGSSTPGIFCAGADLSLDDDTRRDVSDALYELYDAMITLPAVIIAAVDGPAVGGGAQLSLACDLRLWSQHAWLRVVGPGHGLAVGSWALPSLVGRGRTLRLCLTGAQVRPEEAVQIGLADQLCTRDPVAQALDLATQLSDLDPSATVRIKAAVVAQYDLRAALRAEADGNAQWSGSVPR
ncbi:MAG: enoyl-CoA hydratase/isomerase family protein [Jatrophihabitans sp.]|nr:MAG: enoyl-CoA hydratase/isomerase family protein [Jatrophihabitans sp.]